MYRSELFHGFQFDNYPIIDKQIHAEAFIEKNFIKYKAYRFLTINLKTTLLKRLGKNHLVNRFEQSRAKFLVNLYCGSNYFTVISSSSFINSLMKPYPKATHAETRGTRRIGD